MLKIAKANLSLRKVIKDFVVANVGRVPMPTLNAVSKTLYLFDGFHAGIRQK